MKVMNAGALTRGFAGGWRGIVKTSHASRMEPIDANRQISEFFRNLWLFMAFVG